MNSQQNQFASALVVEPDVDVACRNAIADIRSQLDQNPDLTFVFTSGFDADGFESIHSQLRDQIGCNVLLGCTAESLVGKNREVEMEPALSIWSAVLPNTRLHPFHLSFENTADGGTILGWPDDVDDWPNNADVVLLPEPFSFPTDYLLERLKDDRPGLRIMGGVASGGTMEGENRLICNDSLHSGGCVGVLFDGGVALNSVVSQGCRPIGKPMVITKAERNIIVELGGRPAYDQLVELYNELPNKEKLLVQRQLHLGIVTSEYRDSFETGDFLVRNVIGTDAEQKVVAIGNYVRIGQTVQFHVRDETSADLDLTQRLQSHQKQFGDAAAALLFTCNGRGSRMFSVESHDTTAVNRNLGDIPIAGFFAQGEIGPIAGENFVHGFTASIAVFHEERNG
ncbi:MAG: FIST C-terminal domain-containing protein [Planctomycetales bacterium]|nr:FIST C-terminal domain-containing protein [Planctomycetales bacterium]